MQQRKINAQETLKNQKKATKKRRVSQKDKDIKDKKSTIINSNSNESTEETLSNDDKASKTKGKSKENKEDKNIEKHNDDKSKEKN